MADSLGSRRKRAVPRNQDQVDEPPGDHDVYDHVSYMTIPRGIGTTIQYDPAVHTELHAAVLDYDRRHGTNLAKQYAAQPPEYYAAKRRDAAQAKKKSKIAMDNP